MKLIYRTKDGQADYGFSIERQSDGEYRSYITSQPSYRGRSDSAHDSHRYTDSRDNRKYACFEPMPRTESDAKRVAAIWSDRTQEYIRTGKTF